MSALHVPAVDIDPRCALCVNLQRWSAVGTAHREFRKIKRVYVYVCVCVMNEADRGSVVVVIREETPRRTYEE